MSEDVRDTPLWMSAAEAVASGVIEGIDVAGCMQDVLRERDRLLARITDLERELNPDPEAHLMGWGGDDE